jgi:hypothetical protein
VYIGALRIHPEKVAAELKLPPGVFPIFGLVIGKPDPSKPAALIKPRLPQLAVLHRERYEIAPQEDAIDVYDKVMRRFYASQGLPEEDWTRHSAARVRNAEALGGRARLVEAIVNLGFKID